MSQPEYREKYGLQTVWQPYFAPFTLFTKPQIQVLEKQEMLIAHNSMSHSDWQAMRVLTWLYELLYFNRHLLQLPILLMHGLAELSFAQIFQSYLEEATGEITSPLLIFLKDKAAAIQQGETELCVGPWAQEQKVWLTVDHYLFTGLVSSGALPRFYAEQKKIFSRILEKAQRPLPPGVLEEAILLALKLTQAQLQSHPFQMTLSSNLWEVFQQILRGQLPEWRSGPEIFVWPQTKC